ncbi:MAG: YHS domain-containing protein, partial [Gammaproteobacteria bacterium]|nr:YHS domain-containing protein [Gammaproteobacteria bacterium]
MTVTANSSHHHTHENQQFFFCSAGCQNKFASNAAKYLVEGSDRNDNEV